MVAYNVFEMYLRTTGILLAVHISWREEVSTKKNIFKTPLNG